MANVIDTSGNIFNSKAEAIVVTVNCVGFMGKGMALECAIRYPDVEKTYKQLCTNGNITVGEVEWVLLPGGSFLVLFPTKQDYKHPSKYQFIESGLVSLVTDCTSRGLQSIAVPRLGAELGGLDWTRVQRMITDAFSKTEMDLELWSFGSDELDPVIEALGHALVSNPAEATRAAGVSLVQVEALSRFIEGNTLSSLTDLLRVPGIGKTTVCKLVHWLHEAAANPQSTLFDI